MGIIALLMKIDGLSVTIQNLFIVKRLSIIDIISHDCKRLYPLLLIRAMSHWLQRFYSLFSDIDLAVTEEVSEQV